MSLINTTVQPFKAEAFHNGKFVPVSDASLRGAPSGHMLDVREVRLAAGAGFVTLVCGDIMTMPGLPASPSAERIDLDDSGRVVGLF